MVCTNFAKGRMLSVNSDTDINDTVKELRKLNTPGSTEELKTIARNAIIEHNQTELINKDLQGGTITWIDYNNVSKLGTVYDVQVNIHKDNIDVVLQNGGTMTFSLKDGYDNNGNYSSDIYRETAKHSRYSDAVLNSRNPSDSVINEIFANTDVTSGSINDIAQKMIELDINKLDSQWDEKHSKWLSDLTDNLFAVSKEVRKQKIRVTANTVEDLLEPLGEYNPDAKENSIRVATSDLEGSKHNRFGMSNQEALVHEVVHASLNWVFSNMAGIVGSDLKILMRNLYKNAKNKMTVDMLMPDGMEANLEEQRKAQELYDYMFSGKLGDVTVGDAAVRLQEFMALAMTNKNVKHALSMVESTPNKSKKIKENETWFDKGIRLLVDTVYKIMFALKSNKVKGKTLEEEATKLVIQLAKVQDKYGKEATASFGTKIVTNIANEVNNAFDAVDDKTKKHLDKLFEKIGIAKNTPKTEYNERTLAILNNIQDEYKKIKDKGTLRKYYFIARSLPKLRVVYQIGNMEDNPGKEILVAFNKLMYVMKFGEDSFIRQLMADFTAGRKTLEKITDLTMQFRSHLDRLRELNYTGTLSHVKEGFKKLDIYATKNVKYNEALKSVILDSDLQALDMNIEEIQKLLEKPNEVTKKIKELENKITKNSPDYIPGSSDMILDRTRRMARYMITGMGLRTNAKNIARLFGSPYAIKITNDSVMRGIDNMAKDIDQLGSLYALQITDGHKNLLDLINIDKDGVQHFLTLSKGMNEVAIEDWESSNLRHELVKGQMHILGERQRDLRIMPMYKQKELKQDGYEFIKEIKHHSADSDKTKYGLFINYNTNLAKRVDGAMGLQRVHIPGLLLSRKIAMSNPELTDSEVFKLFLQTKSTFDMHELSDDVTPIYNEDGHIIDYRYNISTDNSKKYKGAETKGTEVLARSYGQSNTQELTDNNDKKLIDWVYQDNKKFDDKIGNSKKEKLPEMFLHIQAKEEDLTEEERRKIIEKGNKSLLHEGKYGIKTKGEELWALLPPTAKKYIIEKNNKIDKIKFERKRKLGLLEPGEKFVKKNRREMYIRKDLVAQLFGYDEMMITNLKLFKHMKKYTKRKMMTGERYFRDLISLLKANVVVKLPATVTGNIWSNAKFLWYSGMPLKKSVEYLLLSRKSLVEWKKLEIQKQRTEQLIASTDGKIKNKYKKELADIEYAMNNNPLKQVIDWGLYQSVVEDVNIYDETNSVAAVFNKKLEKVAKKDGLVNEMVQTALMSKRSKLGQLMTQITQESDFHFRAALYWHGLDKGIPLPKIKRDITDNFINYSKVINSPFIQTLDRLGPEAFWKYFSNIQRITIRQFKEHSNRVLADWLGQKFIGLPSGIYQSSIVEQIGRRLNPFETTSGLFGSAFDLPILNLFKL